MYEDLSFLYGSGTYAIYLRKSRKDLDAEAMGEGETLSRHLDILKALAKRMELNVVKVYAEVVSGESIDARPQMQELLRDVETGIYDGVLVVEVERLARGDTSDQGRVAKTFKFSNTLIITPSRPTTRITNLMRNTLSLDFSCPAGNIRPSAVVWLPDPMPPAGKGSTPAMSHPTDMPGRS